MSSAPSIVIVSFSFGAALNARLPGFAKALAQFLLKLAERIKPVELSSRLKIPPLIVPPVPIYSPLVEPIPYDSHFSVS